MYEKFINGKLMSKSSPGSAWEPLSHAELNKRLIAKDEYIACLIAALDEALNGAAQEIQALRGAAK